MIEIRPQHARAQHRIHVLGVGADGRDQPARALDADALQHLFAARVRFDGERAIVHRRLDPHRIALDDDVRHVLTVELIRHDAADSAVAADDEVIFQLIQHAPVLPPLQSLRQAAFDHESGQQREGVQRRPDAGAEQSTTVNT